MTRIRIPMTQACTPRGTRAGAGAPRTPDAPRQRAAAPATALVALLFGLAVPGAHAAYIGNAYASAVGAAPPAALAFAHAGNQSRLVSQASAPRAGTGGAGTRAAVAVGPTTAGSGGDDEIAFNSTLTLAGIGLLCLIAHRRHAGGRRT